MRSGELKVLRILCGSPSGATIKSADLLVNRKRASRSHRAVGNGESLHPSAPVTNGRRMHRADPPIKARASSGSAAAE
jgi:hypothetical protein